MTALLSDRGSAVIQGNAARKKWSIGVNGWEAMLSPRAFSSPEHVCHWTRWHQAFPSAAVSSYANVLWRRVNLNKHF